MTSLECFEHLVDPVEEIEKLFSISPNVLFTTNLLPHPVPRQGEWWYYGFEHGQHISFYSIETLRYLAQKYAKNLYSFGSIHLLTDKKINNWLFVYAIKYARNEFFINLIKKLMKSKTVDDMNYVIERQKKEREVCAKTTSNSSI